MTYMMAEQDALGGVHDGLQARRTHLWAAKELSKEWKRGPSTKTEGCFHWTCMIWRVISVMSLERSTASQIAKEERRGGGSRHLVDCGADGAHGKASSHSGLARRRLTEPRGEDVPHDDLGDVRRLDSYHTSMEPR